MANGQILLGSSGNGIDIFERGRGLVGGYRAHAVLAGTLPDATILWQTQEHLLFISML